MNITKKKILMGLMTAVAVGALTTFADDTPPTVELTKVQQDYPWSTDVKFDFEVTGAKESKYFLKVSLITAEGKTYTLREFDQYVKDDEGRYWKIQDADVPYVSTCPNLLHLPETNCSFTATWKPDREMNIPRELFLNAKFKVEVFKRDDAPYTPYLGYLYFGDGEAYAKWNTNGTEQTPFVMMRRIPAGTFRMGHMVGPGEFAGFKDVTLTKDFYMSTTAITKEYVYGTGLVEGFPKPSGNHESDKAILTYEQLRGNVGPGDQPTSGSFIDRLRQQTGLADLDLPTLAQYRYVCAGGRNRLCMVYPDTMLNFSVNDAGHMVVTPYDTATDGGGLTKTQVSINKYLSEGNIRDFDGVLNNYSDAHTRLHTWAMGGLLSKGAYFVRDWGTGTEYGLSAADFAALESVDPLLTATGENSHPLWAGSPSAEAYCFNDCCYSNSADIGFFLVSSGPQLSEPEPLATLDPVTASIDLREVALWSWKAGDTEVKTNGLPRRGHAIMLRYDREEEHLPWVAGEEGEENVYFSQITNYLESFACPTDANATDANWGRPMTKTKKKIGPRTVTIDAPAMESIPLTDGVCSNWKASLNGPGLYELWSTTNGTQRICDVYLWSPLSLEIKKARQRYPWNGKIDVDYESENGDGSSELELVLTANGEDYVSDPSHLSGATSCGGIAGSKPSPEVPPMTAGPHQNRITWDAAADGATGVDKNASLILRAKKK